MKREAQIHYEQAISAALHLYALSRTPFPEAWKFLINEELYTTLTSFAIHARRLCELENIKNGDFQIPNERLRPKKDDASELETDFFWALNKVIHANDYTAVWGEAHRPDILHEKELGYQFPCAVEIETNFKSHGRKAVSIHELADTFLTSVASFLQQRHPTQFSSVE